MHGMERDNMRSMKIWMNMRTVKRMRVVKRYEEEETQQPPEELLEYLELRRRLKEDIRKQRKKELGSANGFSREIKKALPRDNYGSFFGPSQPVIARIVIQESKSLLENPNLAAKLMKSNHNNNTSSASKHTGSKSVPPKIIGGPNGKRVLTPGVKSNVPALHKPIPSKLQPSIPRQSLVHKKEILQSGKSKVMPKQAESSYKPIMQKQAVLSSKSQIKQLPPKNATRSLEDRRPARKPVRHDEEEDGAEAISSMIRGMFRYNPNRYRDEDDTSDVEANFDDILREEKRSAKIAKKEDEEELRKILEEEKRERLRKQAKKRKLSHQ